MLGSVIGFLKRVARKAESALPVIDPDSLLAVIHELPTGEIVGRAYGNTFLIVPDPAANCFRWEIRSGLFVWRNKASTKDAAISDVIKTVSSKGVIGVQ